MAIKPKIGCVILLAVSCLLANHGKAEAGNIILTGSAWPPWETAHAMDKLGLSPEVTYEFRKYADSIALFKAGRADGILVNLYDYLLLCRDRKIAEETVIILITNHSQGGDMVIARPQITKIADLKGKRVGLDIKSISLYMLHLALQQEGFRLDDVELMRIKAEHVSMAFEKNKSLSAIVGWNPFASQAIANGGKKLADSAAFPGKIVDVMAVWRSSLNKNRRIYRNFLKAWFEARNSPQVLAKMAELNEVDVEEFSTWLADATIFDTAEDSLQAMSKAPKEIESIDGFFSSNRAAVPDYIKQNFAPREFGGTLLDVSLLEELVH